MTKEEFEAIDRGIAEAGTHAERVERAWIGWQSIRGHMRAPLTPTGEEIAGLYQKLEQREREREQLCSELDQMKKQIREMEYTISEWAKRGAESSERADAETEETKTWRERSHENFQTAERWREKTEAALRTVDRLQNDIRAGAAKSIELQQSLDAAEIARNELQKRFNKENSRLYNELCEIRNKTRPLQAQLDQAGKELCEERQVAKTLRAQRAELLRALGIQGGLTQATTSIPKTEIGSKTYTSEAFAKAPMGWTKHSVYETDVEKPHGLIVDPEKGVTAYKQGRAIRTWLTWADYAKERAALAAAISDQEHFSIPDAVRVADRTIYAAATMAIDREGL